MNYKNTIRVLNITETLLVTIREEYWSSFIPIFKKYLSDNRLNKENYSAWREAFWDTEGFLDYKISLKEEIKKKDLKFVNKILDNLKYELYCAWVKEISPNFNEKDVLTKKEAQNVWHKVY